ncbi:MAG: helix-turn-helix domain-containing protein, partial [Thermodesulfobacteriota bacterium]
MKHMTSANDKVVKLSDYLTVRQASKMCDRSEAALRKRIQDGKLCFIKVAHAVLIPRNEVEKLKITNSTQEDLERQVR